MPIPNRSSTSRDFSYESVRDNVAHDNLKIRPDHWNLSYFYTKMFMVQRILLHSIHSLVNTYQKLIDYKANMSKIRIRETLQKYRLLFIFTETTTNTLAAVPTYGSSSLTG